jgi:rRNA maturation endonuclease Nob1
MGLARLAPLAMRAGPAAMRYGRKGVQAVKNLFGSTKPFQGPVGSSVPGKLVAQPAKGVRIPSSGTYDGVKFVRTPGSTSPAGQAMGEAFVPNPFGSYLGGTMSGKAAIGLYKGATSPTAVGLTQKAGKAIWATAKDPLTIAAAAYYFYPDGTPKPDKELEMQGPPPPGGLEKLLTDTDNKGAAGSGVELSPKEKRAAQVEKYRDIMDIKGMNKEAAYDSLIAASQAVNQAGGDLKGAIRDGSLINQIIQSTSKAFDKPKKTKDAIDTLILKGEIEKDIKASDPSAKLLNEYRLKQMEKIDKDLNTGFAEAKIAASKNLSGQAAINAAASVASDNYKGNIITTKQLTDVMEAAKKSGDISEQDIIISATQEVIKGKNLPDGDYTVGDVLVTITEGQVTDIKR